MTAVAVIGSAATTLLLSDDRNNAAHRTGPRSAESTDPPCHSGGTHPRTGRQTLRHGDADRTYLVDVPDGYPRGTPYPLVVNFHGHGGNAQKTEANTLMARTGTARGYIVVTPSAASTPPRWNWRAEAGEPDDAGFVQAMVADVERTLCVDSRRRYVAGHSNGAAFAAVVACRPPYLFAAVAMVSGTAPGPCPPDVAPAVLAVHGTADPAVPYDGGTNALGRDTTLPSVPSIIEDYARRYRCRDAPLRDQPAAGVERIGYQQCADRSAVVLVTVTGGTHPWPGTDAAARDPRNSAAGREFPATDAILDFFDARAHVR
jgi:polyhydroxybutyrate depolymerase